MAEATQEWVTQGEGGTRGALRLMRWLGQNVPGPALDPLIWLISLFYTLRSGRAATRASRAYLRRVLGRDPSFAECHRHARTFAHVLLDRVRLLSDGVEGFRIDPAGQKVIEDLHTEGRGAVLLSGHFGSFESLRAFDRSLPGMRIRYLMYPENAQKSSALLAELNSDVAARVISLKSGPDAMLEVFEALDQGEFVGFLGDRLPSLESRSHLSVDFMDGTIRVPTSPYVAALVARVPVILCFAPRLGRQHYAPLFTVLHDGTHVPRAERDATCAAMAQTYADTLEDLCRQHPYNWFNFFDIWAGGDDLHSPAAGKR
ncbi:MAG: acyl-CoA synthetase [Pseudomonadota bacterium]